MGQTGQHLSMHQQHSLLMTQELQQSLKLLQLSCTDLALYIEEELAKNPLLEVEKPEQEEAKETEVQTEQPSSSTDVFEATEQESIPKHTETVLDDRHWDVGKDHTPNGNSEHDLTIEQSYAKNITLSEYLFDQMLVEFDQPHNKLIATHLIYMLDPSGYIQSDFSKLAERLDCSIDDIKEVLERLQQSDPPGIFARSLSECMALQLKDRNHFDPAMEQLLEHLELVAKGDIEALARICKVSKDDVVEMCQEIKQLNPKPASDFASEASELLQPDVFVTRHENGNDFIIELNHEALPKLLINHQYYSEVKLQAKDLTEKKYLSHEYSSANWLVNSLKQRAETILKVATEIVAQQRGFFEQGVLCLKPMVLKDIAAAIDMHESTVARVTSNKYISTPEGVYPFKFFFSSAIESASGEQHYSSEAVKQIIKDLIKSESPEEILSDDKLSCILKRKGIEASRRTVSKYRDAMKIPSSFERKKQKRLQA